MREKAKVLLWLLIVFFAVLYAAWAVNRHNHFGTDAVDLGIFDQPLWRWSRLEPPLSTLKYNQYPGAHILGDHFHPILFPVALLFRLWDDVRLLLVLQAVVVALSSWPLYEAARRVTGRSFFALALSFAYLAFIGIQAAINYDFHETTLSVLPLALSLYFLIFQKYRWFWLSFLLGLFFKEDMPLFYAAVGLFAVLKLKRWRLGVAVLAVSAVYYYLVTQKFIPFFKGDRFAYEELDPELGETTLDLLKTTLVSPWTTLTVLFFPVIKLKTILNYLASFAFLPLLDPLSLLLALPNLMTRFLTQLPQRWIIRFQYGAVLSPLLAIGAAYGTANLYAFFQRLGWFNKVAAEERFWRFLAVLLLVAPLVQTWRVGTPLFLMFNPDSYRDEPRLAVNRQLLAMIPPQASVMAQSAFVPHLTHRKEIYRYEDTLLMQTQPQYILMSLAEHSDPPFTVEQLRERVLKLREDPRYEVVFWDGERLLMRRK
jgi:uncharacterized membrane protein